MTTYSDRLVELIPPKSLADNYINRNIFGVQDFKAFDYFRSKGINLLVKGPTQSGKTLAFRAYAASRQIPSITIDVGAAMDPALTLNTYVRGPNGEMIAYDGLLTLALREGDAVIVQDECNMAHPKVMAAYHSLGDHRRSINIIETGEVVKCAPNVLIAATMNPDYIGTSPIGQAYSARWKHVTWDYDSGVEKKLLSPGIRKLADSLRKSEYIHTPVSTHMLMGFQDIVSDMGYDFAVGLFTNGFHEDESQGLMYALSVDLADQIKEELE